MTELTRSKILELQRTGVHIPEQPPFHAWREGDRRPDGLTRWTCVVCNAGVCWTGGCPPLGPCLEAFPPEV